jgi:8-oxo-dGTP pyrophosphatase MutT (NUDIX family)
MKPTKVLSVIFRYSHTSAEPQILLLKLSVARGSKWHFLTGYMEPEEDERTAITRILLEETGLEEICSWHDLNYHYTFTSSDGATVCEAAYGIEVQASKERIHLSSAHADFRWVEPEEAFALLEWDTQKEALRTLLQLLQQEE